MRSSIDDILEGENVTLRDVLADEEVVQECKNRNEKLLDFLSTNDKLQELLECALEDSWRNEEDPSLTERDFGQVATDILSSDIDVLEHHFVGDEQLLSQLFHVLDATENLSDNLSSRFTKIASHLLNRKGNDVMAFVQASGDTFVSSISNHIGDEGMDDLMLRFMGIEVKDESAMNNFPFAQLKMRESSPDPESKPDPVAVAKWWLERNILTSLIDNFEAEQSPQVYANVSKVLTEIAKKQPENSPLSERIRSTEMINQLLEKVLDNTQTDILQHVIPVLSTIITTSVTADAQADVVPEGIQTIIERVPQFAGILDTAPEASFSTPAGELNPPLGATRLRLVEFFDLLFQLSYDSVQEALISSSVLSKLLDLMFQYENNNLLHNIVTDIICIIINSESDALKKHLFEDAKLLQRILKAEKENRKYLQEPKSQRKPYMGHIILISNVTAEAAKEQPYIEELVSNQENWQKWVSAGLKERNRAESSVLGGPTPLAMDYNAEYDDYDDDDDDDEEPERILVEDDDIDNTLVVKMDVEAGVATVETTEEGKETEDSEQTTETEEKEESQETPTDTSEEKHEKTSDMDTEDDEGDNRPKDTEMQDAGDEQTPQEEQKQETSEPAEGSDV